jgi:hypothetical protein
MQKKKKKNIAAEKSRNGPCYGQGVPGQKQ